MNIPRKFISLAELSVRWTDSAGVAAHAESILSQATGDIDYVRLRVNDAKVSAVLASEQADLLGREAMVTALETQVEAILLRSAFGITTQRLDEALELLEAATARRDFQRLKVAALERFATNYPMEA